MSEFGIDDIHFDDFSLDVDAMITAALRMFMELGMVQKFKIDYEVTICSVKIPAALSWQCYVHLYTFSSPDTICTFCFRHCVGGF